MYNVKIVHDESTTLLSAGSKIEITTSKEASSGYPNGCTEFAIYDGITESACSRHRFTGPGQYFITNEKGATVERGNL